MFFVHPIIARLVNNGSLVLLTAMFFWGANAVAGKMAYGEVSPILLTFFRWTISSLILFPFVRKKLAVDWPVIREKIGYFLFMAPIGFTAFNIALYTALTYTSALNATIEQAAMPMFIFLINFLIFRTKPLVIQIIGYGITLMGVVLTVTGGDVGRVLALDFNVGDLIMMLAAVFYAAFSVGLRSKPDVHWLSFLFVLTSIASFISVPFVLYEASTSQFVWPATPLGWGIVAYAAIFPSIVSQACFIRGNELLGANNAALFLNMVPIFGALLAVFVLREAFYWYHALAMVYVLGGIMLAQHFTRVKR